MTIHTLSEARARRARLFNPPNGRNSTELDIVPNDAWSRKKAVIRDRLERQRAAEDFKKRAAVEAAIKTSRAADGLLTALEERAHVVAIAKRIVVDDEWYDVSPPSITEIFRTVCRYYKITRTDFMSSRRTEIPVFARQVAMYLARTLTFRSMPEIGRLLNKKDHTTVLHGVRKIEAKIAADPKFAAEIAEIKKMLGVP